SDGGYSLYSPARSVDSRIGGDKGMKQFIQFAHTLDIPVYLDTNYMFDTSKIGKLTRRQNGLRDMGGTVKGDIVSLGHLESLIDDQISYFKELGTDGITLGASPFNPQGFGRTVNSDYNNNFPFTREESRVKQQDIMKKFKDAGIDLRGASSAAYSFPYLSTIERMIDDYSYDSFSDTAIPFIQIALHGLVNYSSQYVNERQEYQKQFLRDLEYGSAPSFIFIYENGEDFKNANELHLFNPNFPDWETQAVAEYQRMNEALGDVQNKFIINHRTLAPDVKETTFEGGKRIIVNYGPSTYFSGNITVRPMDYLIVKGG
ncbi:MAG: hypothetical protein K0Q59_4105, partial [Paenibacillus sp.]|nr:hypothetical protein [Paenibacillus sp.]